VSESHSYVTYFDSGYLARGLTLIASLRKNGDHSPVWVLCLDDETHAFLTEIGDDSIRLLTINEVEAFEPRLLPLKFERSRMEYYFTCTPILMQLVQRRAAKDHVVIYLDSDLFFFDDPERVLAAMRGESVGIIGHRYPSFLAQHLAKYGTYNVGWVGFRNEKNGNDCLDWYVEKCLEWCHDTPSEGRYADQGYLNSFASLFSGVVVITDPGINMAPWNTWRLRVSSGKTAESAPLINGSSPLVFFHFHGIKPRGQWQVTSQLVYFSPMGRAIRELIYRPYLAELAEVTRRVQCSPLISTRKVASRGKGLRGALFTAQRVVSDVVSIATRNALRL
jgi:hypothetical protein